MNKHFAHVAFIFLVAASPALADKPNQCARFASAFKLRATCAPLFSQVEALDCSDLKAALDEMERLNKECDVLAAGDHKKAQEQAAALTHKLDAAKNMSPEQKEEFRRKLAEARAARKASQE